MAIALYLCSVFSIIHDLDLDEPFKFFPREEV